MEPTSRAFRERAIVELAESLDRCAHVIDDELAAPAQWRGPLRREIRGRRYAHEHRQYQRCFNELTREPESIEITSSQLRRLHAQVTASSSSSWRTTSAIVRQGERTWSMPAASRVPDLVEAALSAPSNAPPLVRASQLHLDLLIIHPFSDGNGRATRLFASSLLLRAGYRSTLVTAVEQHNADDPSEYYRRFATLCDNGEFATLGWIESSLRIIQRRLQVVACRLENSARCHELLAPSSDAAAASWWFERLRAEIDNSPVD